jgi:hypothetical protein
MDLKAKVLDFLVNLPEVDSPDKRKGLVTYTSFPHLGIYLDWQGANVAFFPRLLDELGRRGKEALVQFLEQLPQWPGLGLERAEVAAHLRREVEGMSAESWESQFVIVEGIGQEEKTPDPVMLATSVVATVLTPYFKLGPDALRQQGDANAVRLAEKVWGLVEATFAGDPAAGWLKVYQKSPEESQEMIIATLRDKIATDPALAKELGGLLAQAGAADEAALRTLINVAQQAGTVKGSLVGAIFGQDALPHGADISVNQKIDMVEEDAGVVGVVWGGNAPVNVGGKHHHGDRVEGNKQEVDTGGGAYIGGNVTAGRDFVGRDKHGVPDDTLEELFAPLWQQLQQATGGAIQTEALQKVEALKAEAGRGENADDDRMADLIGELVELAPSVAETVVGLFSSTILARVAGGGTQYVIRQLRGQIA